MASNSLVFIDPSTLRRSTSAVSSGHEPVTMATTAACLARSFAIVLRQIADLLAIMSDYSSLAPTLPETLEVTYQDQYNLQVSQCYINILTSVFTTESRYCFSPVS